MLVRVRHPQVLVARRFALLASPGPAAMRPMSYRQPKRYC
jgi:hypothetical protein